jgi:heterodisulfide reductase subunit A-like polyferredoxin
VKVLQSLRRPPSPTSGLAQVNPLISTMWYREVLISALPIGCFTCRLRRKKCDEKHPSCGACSNLCVKCEYKRPVWWGNAEQRKLQKERIKNKIKQTKMNERNGSLTLGSASPPAFIFTLHLQANEFATNYRSRNSRAKHGSGFTNFS